MQATVHRFDQLTQAGTLLTDDGLLLAFDAEAFARSGLRTVRQGQRLSLEVSADPSGTPTVVRVWLGSIVPPVPR